LRRSTLAYSTLPKEHRPSWCPLQTSSNQQAVWPAPQFALVY